MFSEPPELLRPARSAGGLGVREHGGTAVATRRRGGADLDDLKARLGLNAPESAPAPAADEDGDAPTVVTAGPNAESDEADAPSEVVAAAPAAAPPAALAAAPAPPKAPAPAPALADNADAEPKLDTASFATAVSDAESATFDAIDPNATEDGLKAPGSGAPVALILACIVSLVAGAALGLAAASGNEVRKLVNAQVTSAEQTVAAIQPIADTLRTLNADLAGIIAENGYEADFETTLRAVYGDTRPVVDSAEVTAAGPLLAYDGTTSRLFVSYAISTQFLSELVSTHLRKTERDLAEIQREIAAVEDTRGVGIAFSFDEMVGQFNALFDDPELVWQPLGGERVSFESLDVQTEGEGDEARRFYTVESFGGEEIEVPVHDLVVLPRQQLLPEITTETPLLRYRARAAQIKEVLSMVVEQQEDLLTRLGEISSQDVLFTF